MTMTSTISTVGVASLSHVSSSGKTLTPDVLDSFNAPPKSSLGKHAQEPERPSSSIPTGPLGGSASSGAGALPSEGVDGDEDFEASLVEGMESLLRSLANEHPPGPMADGLAGPSATTGAREATPALSSEEEERAFQKAVEMMLSGEGMDALGVGKGAGAGPAVPASGTPKSGGSGTPKPPPASFDETIRKTMESINQGGANAPGGGDMPDDIAALLKQLSENPGALDGFGDGDEDDLGGLLDGMMAQLMSKEVLEEPMTELAAKVGTPMRQSSLCLCHTLADPSTLDTLRNHQQESKKPTWSDIAHSTRSCSRSSRRSSARTTPTT